MALFSPTSFCRAAFDDAVALFVQMYDKKERARKSARNGDGKNLVSIVWYVTTGTAVRRQLLFGPRD
jgi:hypothetical protein